MQLEVGSVIRLYVTDTTPQKVKRFVVIAANKDGVLLGTLYLNSEINKNVFRTKHLKELQLDLDSEGRDYLDNPSFLDCSYIHQKTINELTLQVFKEPSSLIGKMDNSDLNKAKEKIQTAKTISKKVKEWYGLD